MAMALVRSRLIAAFFVTMVAVVFNVASIATPNWMNIMVVNGNTYILYYAGLWESCGQKDSNVPECVSTSHIHSAYLDATRAFEILSLMSGIVVTIMIMPMALTSLRQRMPLNILKLLTRRIIVCGVASIPATFIWLAMITYTTFNIQELHAYDLGYSFYIILSVTSHIPVFIWLAMIIYTTSNIHELHAYDLGYSFYLSLGAGLLYIVNMLLLRLSIVHVAGGVIVGGDKPEVGVVVVDGVSAPPNVYVDMQVPVTVESVSS